MRIQNNITALNTMRQLGINTADTSKITEKLSSGFRINRAADDAAGLYISEKMRSQIRGLNQASANAQDGISLIQAAEGALDEAHKILQRMRELAVKGANDVLENDDDRKIAIQSELNALNSELDRIASATEFNKKTLLNGSLQAGQKFGVTEGPLTAINIAGVVPKGDVVVAVTVAAVTQVTTYEAISAVPGTGTTSQTGAASIEGVIRDSYGNVGDLTGIQIAAGSTNGDILNALVAAVNTHKESLYTATINGGQLILTAKEAGAPTNMDGTPGIPPGAITFTDVLDGTSARAQMTGPGFSAAITAIPGANAQITITDSVNGTINANFDTATGTYSNGMGVAFRFLDGGQPTNSGTYTIQVNEGTSLTLQVGANAGANQTIAVGIGKLDSIGLGTAGVNVNNHANAQTAIRLIDGAVGTLSAQRANLGAVQNRLEHTVANLDTISENLANAESAVRDLDMAKGMVEFTKNQILTQAATAMLAQANQMPQTVLQLLR